MGILNWTEGDEIAHPKWGEPESNPALIKTEPHRVNSLMHSNPDDQLRLQRNMAITHVTNTRSRKMSSGVAIEELTLPFAIDL